MKNKKLLSVIFLLLAFTVTGCTNSGTPNLEKMPITDSLTTETQSTQLQTTKSENSLKFSTSENTLRLSGKLSNDKYNYLIISFDNEQNDSKALPVVNYTIDEVVEIPDIKNELTVDLYAGEAEYGQFESVILDFIKIRKSGGSWEIVKSPVYNNNMAIHNTTKEPIEFLLNDERVQSDDPEIISLSDSIIQDETDQYKKVKAIHDWMITNIYYDFDSFRSGNYEESDAKTVLLSKKGVCEGFANLMAALVRAQKIPCRVQGGYALGIDTNREWHESNIGITESNHAWNEIFVDGSWMIVDSTWDTHNKYENGEYIKSDFTTDIYFDSDMEFFSLSHKLI